MLEQFFKNNKLYCNAYKVDKIQVKATGKKKKMANSTLLASMPMIDQLNFMCPEEKTYREAAYNLYIKTDRDTFNKTSAYKEKYVVTTLTKNWVFKGCSVS